MMRRSSSSVVQLVTPAARTTFSSSTTEPTSNRGRAAIGYTGTLFFPSYWSRSMNLKRWGLLSAILIFLTTLALGADWPSISDADRSLMSIPEQPGAPAVILLREQTDDNMNNLLIVYERIKILTDAGRKYATMELPYSRAFNVATLSGRTVHADGRVTPFTGKPFDETVSGTDG